MLTGVHFLLSYMCNYECDHCFLSSGPGAEGTFTLSQIRDVLTEAKKIGSVGAICFEGGEPFMQYPMLVEAVSAAAEMGFETAIETNCYWATSAENAELWLAPLIEAGLGELEVSDDEFHHGEVAESPAKRAAAAAKKLGLDVSSICIDKPSVGAPENGAGGEPIYTGGPKMRGRAARTLIEGLPRRPWAEFTECPHEDLAGPGRVHVDAYGNVLLCQGLSMGNMWEKPLSELVRDYKAEKHPVAGPLAKGGPAGLARACGIEPEEGYVDACHFCTELCIALIGRFPDFITPRQVYGLE